MQDVGKLLKKHTSGIKRKLEKSDEKSSKWKVGDVGSSEDENAEDSSDEGEEEEELPGK